MFKKKISSLFKTKARKSRDMGDQLLRLVIQKDNPVKEMLALIDQGADLTRRGFNGYTILHWAAWLGYEDVVKAVLATKQLNVDVQSGHENRNLYSHLTTPLMLSSHRGHKKLVELFLDQGADPQLCDAHGRSAIDLTRPPYSPHPEISALLESCLPGRHNDNSNIKP